MRLFSVFASTFILMTILSIGASTSNNPAFLPRDTYSTEFDAVVENRPFVRSNSLEAVVLSSDDGVAEESDSEARFALQYENEEVILRRSESSYLVQDREKNLDSSVIAASMSQRKAKYNDSLEL